MAGFSPSFSMWITKNIETTLALLALVSLSKVSFVSKCTLEVWHFGPWKTMFFFLNDPILLGPFVTFQRLLLLYYLGKYENQRNQSKQLSPKSGRETKHIEAPFSNIFLEEGVACITVSPWFSAGESPWAMLKWVKFSTLATRWFDDCRCSIPWRIHGTGIRIPIFTIKINHSCR